MPLGKLEMLRLLIDVMLLCKPVMLVHRYAMFLCIYVLRLLKSAMLLCKLVMLVLKYAMRIRIKEMLQLKSAMLVLIQGMCLRLQGMFHLNHVMRNVL